MSNDIQLSAVIVNYNGFEYADKCVASIFASKTKNLEVIVVDNGSVDGSQEKLSRKYGRYGKKFTLVELDRNYGPAKARNAGVAVAKGEFLAFLDNDTMVDESWAEEAIQEFLKSSGTGAVQCKLLLSKERNKIDYVGEYLGQNGFLVQRARAGSMDTGKFNQRCEILAAKSAGMFIRKKVFEIAGGFDDDYFIYVEETDLGWRSWLSGYKVVYVPSSIVYHEFGTSSVILGKSKNNYNAKFHGCKNYILTLFKNLDSVSLVKILPVHIILWLGLGWYALIKRDAKSFFWIHKAVWWNVSNLKTSLRKRKIIQKNRKINDDDLFKIVMRKKPLSYFIKKVIIPHKVGNAEGFIKKN